MSVQRRLKSSMIDIWLGSITSSPTTSVIIHSAPANPVSNRGSCRMPSAVISAWAHSRFFPFRSEYFANCIDKSAGRAIPMKQPGVHTSN